MKKAWFLRIQLYGCSLFRAHSTIPQLKVGTNTELILAYYLALYGILLNSNIRSKKEEEKNDFKTNKEANDIKLRCFPLYLLLPNLEP